MSRPQNPFPSQRASYTWLVQRRISNVGLLWNKASDAWLGIPAFTAKDRKASFAELVAQNLLIEVIVEGLTVPLYLLTKDQHFLDAVLTTEHFKPRLEFIAPLDPLLWDRQLVRELFDFDYKWEIYTPVNQRRFGHYVLPILYGTQFIGRIELKNKRQEGHLELTNYWLEAGINLTAALKGELNSTLKQMAEFNGCLTWDSFN
ncbi:winged helix DNA-binding domain-containing protein [Vagococcus sp. BWB3-3]|uniref:Winged helix DNA-binding domain-containing protein n=1 Tax=Vagococcus allomyrinae TaxID=2794353 RepID=A0A940PC89_9ENTE|nr:winged helix DNA-binding domain-containing protein [Vagococcus allomyrinae]